jgi:hypothetical protein
MFATPIVATVLIVVRLLYVDDAPRTADEPPQRPGRS